MCGELQVAKYVALEQVAPHVGTDAGVAHIAAASGGSVVGEGCLDVVVLRGGLEQHDVGIVVAGNVETMLLGSADELVVTIDKLHEASRRHAQTNVASRGKSLLALAKVENVVGKVGEVVEGGELRTVVDDDNLALLLAERERHDALDSLAQQIGLGVVYRNDEAN